MINKKVVPIFLTILLINFISAISFIEKWGIKTDQGFNFVVVKYFLLIMLFALLYVVFSFINFLSSPAPRIILALILSILFMLIINPNEILATIFLYKSLYVTIVLFFPLLILGTLTFKALERFDSFGIFLQRTLWGIYGIYLLIISTSLLLFSNNFLQGLNKIFPFNYLWTYFFQYIWKFYDFFGLLKEDNLTGIFLLILSILILYFMSINNDASTKIIKDWIKDARILKEKDIARKFNAARKITAQAVDSS